MRPVVGTAGTKLVVSVGRLRTRRLTNKSIGVIVSTLVTTRHTSVSLNFRGTTTVSLTNHGILRTIGVDIGPGIVRAPVVTNITVGKVRMGTGTGMAMHTGVRHLINNTNRRAVVTHINRKVIAAINSTGVRASILRGPSSVSRAVLGGKLSSNATFRVLSVSVTSISINHGMNTGLRTRRTRTSGQITRTGTRRHHTFTITRRRRVVTRIREVQTGIIRTRTRIPLTLTRTLHGKGVNIVSCCGVGGVVTSARVEDDVSRFPTSEDRPR